MSDHVQVEYCGEWHRIDPPGPFTIGREGDLAVDDNPYLHRRFLEVHHDRFWWLSNVGDHLAATVSDGAGVMTAWLSPGAAMPLAFATTEIRFTAGPTAYLLQFVVDSPSMVANPTAAASTGVSTIRPMDLTENQRLLVLSLAEPALLAGTTTAAALPSSQEAARRLGWRITQFNRQLDSVCEKLSRGGVRGLRGDQAALASSRRGRLVEHAIATRLVTVDDLPLLARAARGGT